MPVGSRPASYRLSLLQFGLPEIEWFVDLGEGENELTVFGGNFADGVTAGEDGANTFWDGVPTPDPPLLPDGPPFLLRATC